MRFTTDHEHSGIEVEILERDRVYTLTEVCTICQLDENGVQEFLDYGVVVHEASDELRFRQSQLDRLLRARRLQDDLELNHAGVALALDLLDTIARLKRDIALLKR
ncbi:chaperone modulator CbpM [Granulosicoccus sp. 3-233]|uniref:chaperone modulator CbpM n=1 Tax=Granulosicoccus sp. 3-233 TaxID=3417969 RepID=UPI003D353570